MTGFLLIAAVLLPLCGGLLLGIWKLENKRALHGTVLAFLTVEAFMITALLFQKEASLTLFSITPALTVSLRMDGVSRLFLVLAGFGFLLSGCYAFRYMEHAGRERSFFSFFLLTQGSIVGLDLAANLPSMYLFFELLTLLSMPMVLHERSPESHRAGMKYLFYSIGGAMIALGTIFVLSRFSDTLDFTAGGVLNRSAVAGHETLVTVAVFLGGVGFSAKAGMYPLHGWLPAAHPVAPAPASAVLSGIVAKAGILTLLRLVYFAAGPDFLRGTWVQYTWLGLALLTVFMGSMMAFREQVLKKRLAYSSVSQLSYILAGLFLMTPQAATGALLHILFHAVIKMCLFLFAGSCITVLGKHRVDELRGMGRAMPLTLSAFLLASLGLIGIPPTAGFVSKWYLALGALNSDVPVFSWLTPVVLLLSALLTAGYLLPVVIGGFFPKKGEKLPERTKEGGPWMLVPICVLGVLSVLLGVFSGPLVQWLGEVAASMF